ncbi:phage BR0599 family protein [Dyella japonica]|uniref:Bacteriophage phiJL001 Gp84 C-terminal domain-containing protein n=1 Tax=Dyella japonica TaxID=231455 RepID=A0ABV2JXF9_9GAMM
MFKDFELSRRGGKPTHLFRFARQGKTWRFAATDRDIVVGGFTWLAAPIAREEIKQTVETAQDSLKVTLPYNRDANNTDPVTQSLGDNWHPYIPSDTVAVACMATHLGDPDQEIIVEWLGQVGQPKFTDGQLELTCVTASSIGKAQRQGAKWQIACWKTVYSTGPRGCNLLKSAFSITVAVDEINGLSLSAAAFAGLDLSLAGGGLEFTDSNGLIQRLSIMAHDGSTIVLLSGAAGLAAGLTVTVYPGCQRTWAACADRDNTINYGGAIYKPVQNPYSGQSMSWG